MHGLIYDIYLFFLMQESEVPKLQRSILKALITPKMMIRWLSLFFTHTMTQQKECIISNTCTLPLKKKSILLFPLTYGYILTFHTTLCFHNSQLFLFRTPSKCNLVIKKMKSHKSVLMSTLKGFSSRLKRSRTWCRRITEECQSHAASLQSTITSLDTNHQFNYLLCLVLLF